MKIKIKKLLAAALLSLCCASAAKAEPVMDTSSPRMASYPYYNMSLSVPTDRHSAYDPAKTWVNDVQNQGGFGTCWAFAAVASAESSVYRQMQYQGIPYNAKTSPVKYSPWYLAWIKSAAPIGLDADEVKRPQGMLAKKSYLLPFAQKVYKGGNSGANVEFSMAMGLDFKEMDPHDKNILIAPRDYAKNNKVHLHNVFYMYNLQEPENIQRLKELLVSCGAAVITVSSDLLDQTGAADFYTSKDLPDNHAVTLIGWDDEYDFSASGMRVKPRRKGAWIVRNSWGTQWADKGDCYLSYESADIGHAESLDLDIGTDCFDYIATHEDRSIFYRDENDPQIVTLSGNAAFGASYAARGNDLIKSVGFYAYDAGMHYTIKVYKNCPSLVDIDKEPDYWQEGAFDGESTPACGGYRIVDLTEPVALDADERYSVEVSLTNDDGESIFVVATDTDEYDIKRVGSYINEGGGVWRKVLNHDDEYAHNIFKVGSVVQRIYLKRR